LDYRRFQSALTTKASADEDRKRNHIYFYAVIKGKRHRITKISHGAKGQVSKSRMGDFARQMHLSNQQLQQFVECSLSRDEWIKLWERDRRQV